MTKSATFFKFSPEFYSKSQKTINSCHLYGYIDNFQDIKISLSAGICHFNDWNDPQTMMSKADSLLYRAKNNGRCGYVLGKENGEILHEKHYQLKSMDKKDSAACC